MSSLQVRCTLIRHAICGRKSRADLSRPRLRTKSAAAGEVNSRHPLIRERGHPSQRWLTSGNTLPLCCSAVRVAAVRSGGYPSGLLRVASKL